MATLGRSYGLDGGRSGGGRGGGGGRRPTWGSPHPCGDEADEARKALVRSIGAKRRAARRWTNQGLRAPPSLAAYVDAGPATPTTPARGELGRHPHEFGRHRAYDEEEEREDLVAAIRLSENALEEELRREREEMEAAIAAVEAAKRAEREAAIAEREAAMDVDVIVLDD